ncbi:GSCFA domain-containing protein [Flavobacteriaceae bacterium S356]|uniref:GSCFA domain-containing protein n=1 Tax=Asprobacillus argus TaxID=3076534 RepID=A0ABU3LB41_9FLAO|nr:GSCFA domain-containing protein [Flavobacteriaceae bacterium S356]
MNFQTQIPISKESRNSISYDSKMFLLGSCFAENMANKLSFYKFRSLQNPFGILFHPKAIEQLVINAINEKKYTNEDIFLLNERWHCFDAHSSMSDSNKETLLNNLNTGLQATNEQLYNASHICITLGTAWVYRHIESDHIVANCHKVPQKKFLKELLSVSEIVASLEAVITLIKSVNRNASIVFTVSPVRHLKDGFEQNQLSKSHLISAIHQVVDGGRTSSYFPSYEIMMDELRDYRFYAEDMIHPNETAIQYIWNRFTEVWISEGAKTTMQEVEKVQNGLSHKPFNPKSEAHLQFLTRLHDDIKKLQKIHPHITF